MRARYYSTALGRFLSRDPIGFDGGINLYAYCNGDPVNYSDPTGLDQSYLQQSWEFFKGEMRAANPVNWIKGAWAAGSHIYHHGWSGVSDVGYSFVDGLKFWEKESAGCIGESFFGGVLAVSPLGKKLPSFMKSQKAATLPTKPALMASVPVKASKVLDSATNCKGEFSIIDWRGYPAGAPRPKGPFRVLSGAEYEAARRAADAANTSIHKANGGSGGKHIHEIHPIKFGGDPVSSLNRLLLTPSQHSEFNRFWARMLRQVKKYQQ